MNTKLIYESPLLDDEEEKKQKTPEQFSEKFLKTRQIILTGEINKELADSIVRQLFWIQKMKRLQFTCTLILLVVM